MLRSRTRANCIRLRHLKEEGDSGTYDVVLVRADFVTP